jgi:hypothetical protein
MVVTVGARESTCVQHFAASLPRCVSMTFFDTRYLNNASTNSCAGEHMIMTDY